ALSGYRNRLGDCSLSDAKRTSVIRWLMSANDPKRTFRRQNPREETWRSLRSDRSDSKLRRLPPDNSLRAGSSGLLHHVKPRFLVIAQRSVEIIQRGADGIDGLDHRIEPLGNRVQPICGILRCLRWTGFFQLSCRL